MTSPPPWRRKVALNSSLVQLLALAGLGVALGLALWGARGARPLDATGFEEAAADSHSAMVARERLLVLVASPDCPSTDRVALRRELNRLREAYGSTSRAGHRIRLLGIAVTERPSEGLRLMRDIGEFDELSLGGGWSNLGVQAFVTRDLAGVAMVPQLVVVDRQLARDHGSLVVSDSLVVRLTGTDAIERWTKRVSQPASRQASRDGAPRS